jgi:hypothetical protein
MRLDGPERREPSAKKSQRHKRLQMDGLSANGKQTRAYKINSLYFYLLPPADRKPV